MGRRIREHDWRPTAFGPIDAWPQSLRSALNICLHSTFPTAIYWGPDLRLLYNDAWAPIPGPRHPWALGRPAVEVWADIWSVIGPQFSHIMATGEGLYTQNQLLPMQRYGYPEETYWNYSFTPIFGEDGTIVGIFNSGHETTAAVLAEERTALLLRLGDRLRKLDSPRKVKATAAEILGLHLRVGRVGYAEAAPDGSLHVEQDWSAGQLASLADIPLSMEWLGAANLKQLRSGSVLRIDQAVADTVAAAFGAAEPRIQARSLLVAPLMRSGELVAIMYLHDTEPRHWRDSDAMLAQEVVEQIWAAAEQARAEVALRESEARFRNLADNAPVMVWVTDRQAHCEYLNRRWYEFTGQTEEEALGTGWLGAVHPEDAPAAMEAFLEANVRKEAFSLEYRLRRRDGVYRWAIDAAAPRFGPGGEHLGYIGSVIDITDRKESEERQNLLMREVDHRAKNVLAVVQAVVRLSSAEEPTTFRRTVQGRIAALARAHSLLSANRWEGVDLDALLRDELAPYRASDRERIRQDGPALLLPPSLAQTLALALHELATNAAKHGSLSGPDGQLTVEWRFEAPERLELSWIERAEKRISPPERRGFGSELVARSIKHQAGGTVTLDWRPEGLACRISVPLRRHQAGEEAAPERTEQASGKRVMIVEDEALIALELEERVNRLGYRVIACVGTLEGAMELAQSDAADIALLDANLHGRLSTPVALELERRRVPLAFVTGYERIGCLPAELQGVRKVTKPVSTPTLARLLAELAEQVPA